MNGYVVSDDDAELYRYFGFSVVSPRDVRQAIADNPEGEPLTLEVNSGGGSMFAGYEIYTILKAAGIPTEVEIQSLAGSATVSYTHLRAHETDSYLVCRLLLEKIFFFNDTATTEIYTLEFVGSVRCV